MLKIKRFQGMVATTKFTVVDGKAPLNVLVDDVVDFDEATEQWMLDTGMFELATDLDATKAEQVYTMEDLQASRAVKEMMGPAKFFNPKSPRNIAIQAAIKKYGSVDDVPDEIRNALGLQEDPEVDEPVREALSREKARRKPAASANNAVVREERGD